MAFRLIADANAQTTIALALTAGATSFVGGATANFTSPQSFGNGVGRLTLLDAGNPAWNPAAPFATPFEYCDYTTNTVGTNTISGITRGVAGTSAHAFFAGAIVAQGLVAEDLIASVPWKFDDQSPTSGSTITIPASGSIPASYLGVNFADIEIEFLIRSSVAALNADLYFQLNGDSATDYVNHTLSGSNSTAGYTNPPGSGVATGIVGIVPGASMVASLFAHGTIKFGNFAQATAFHIGRGESHYMSATQPTTSAIYLRSASWNQLTAITSITIGISAGAFVTGSRIRTYLRS